MSEHHGQASSPAAPASGDAEGDEQRFPVRLRWKLFWHISKDSDIRRELVREFGDFGKPVVERFTREMDRYFTFPRELYPEKSAYPRIGLRSFRYFRIAEADTDRMFPRDADIRRSIDALRRAFVWDIILFTALKRVWLVVFFLVMVVLLDHAIVKGSSLLAYLVSLGLPILFFLVAILGPFAVYRLFLTNSADSIGTLVEHRMTDLKQLLSDLKSEMHSREATKVAQWARDWPAQAAFIAKLIIWVSKRMEYIEKYMQTEMWRIARIQGRARWTGWIVATASFLGVVVYMLLADGQACRSSLAPAFFVICLLTWAFSMTQLNAQSGEIQEIVHRHVSRVAEARLDEIIGSLIQTDKDKIMSLSHQQQDLSSHDSRG